MKIELSPHARQQLEERNITEKEVERVLKDPEEIIESGIAHRQVAHRIFKVKNKKFLYRVIFTKKDSAYFVITVYRTTKLQKYYKKGADKK